MKELSNAQIEGLGTDNAELKTLRVQMTEAMEAQEKHTPTFWEAPWECQSGSRAVHGMGPRGRGGHRTR